MEFCDEAKKYGVLSVNVCPANVKLVAEHLAGTGIDVGAAISFPLGANKTSVKVLETRETIADGATLVDMVINIDRLIDGDCDYVYNEIRAVVEVAGSVPVKVIIECCYLTDRQKVTASKLAVKAGAAVIKTSTGMGSKSATVRDVVLIRKAVAGKARVKAAGGIHCRERAYELIAADAQMLGVSNVPQIIYDDTTIVGATITNVPFYSEEQN